MPDERSLFGRFLGQPRRLAGARQHVPSDRIIDGIDQTALLLPIALVA